MVYTVYYNEYIFINQYRLQFLWKALNDRLRPARGDVGRTISCETGSFVQQKEHKVFQREDLIPQKTHIMRGPLFRDEVLFV